MSAFVNPLHASAHAVLRTDAVMAGLIEAVGPFALQPSRLRSPFEALVRAIAHQQLNGIAAERILGRFVELFGTGTLPAPEILLAAEERQLRSVGFSAAKAAALKDLAAKVMAGVVPPVQELHLLSDLEIIERLTAVRGIGRWTVEMMLIFQLERPDVLPVHDFGVRNGFRLAYGLADLPLPEALARFGERWKPFRSVAAWYLWRAVELSRRGALPRCPRRPRIAIRKLAAKVARVRAKTQKRTRKSAARKSGTLKRASAVKRRNGA
jgi:DNA-3-methyladenine glycosylase II